jgi:hypothetical protein
MVDPDFSSGRPAIAAGERLNEGLMLAGCVTPQRAESTHQLFGAKVSLAAWVSLHEISRFRFTITFDQRERSKIAGFRRLILCCH